MTKKDYKIEVFGLDHEEGDGFIAIYVDFPHIKGDGDTPQEAVAKAKENFQKFVVATIEKGLKPRE